MKPPFRKSVLRPTVLALAVLAACGTAQAQDAASDLRAYVTAGAAGVTGDAADRALFGQYNGLRDRDYYGLLDFGYSRRNADTGVWAEAYGRDLALDTRELGLLWKRQGNWRLTANYGELVRRDPYSVNTGLTGAGSTTPQVNYLTGGPGTGSIFDLETQRKDLGATFTKQLGAVLELEARMNSETRKGSRLFGVGIACPSIVAPGCGPTTATATGSAVLLLPEPIDARHSQAEARLTYGGERVRLSAGYYGSFYRNANGALTAGIPATLNNPLGNPLPASAGLQSVLANAVALAPDSDAHQFDIAGNLVITPAVRATFKLAYATARQDQDFAGAGLAGAPAGSTNLGGRVDTTLAKLAVSARPIPKLSLLADWRYEEKDDKTPLAAYTVEGSPPSALVSTNRLYSSERNRGKLQATYQLPYRMQATAGVDYELIDRGTFTTTSVARGVSALRQETEETGYRLELRRQMSATFSGAISVITSDRDGSNWLRPNSGTGVTEITDPGSGFINTSIFSPTLADRKRDKLKLFANWQATDSLSLQLAVETGKDEYTAPTQYALRDTKMGLYSLDASFVISETWSVNGYLSYGTQKLNQARPAGYILAYDNKNTTAGIGVVGKASEKLDLGASLGYIDDKSAYAQTLDATASANTAALLAATGGLPDILFRRTELRVYGKYALSERSALRLDAVHQRARFNDWAFSFSGTPFLFGDNSTVTQLEQQNVTYLGVGYTYSWR